MKNNARIKTIFIGNSDTGKTNIIQRICKNTFEENPPKEGHKKSDYKTKLIKNKEYYVDLWDISGQPLLFSSINLYIKNSHIVFFVYDITNKKSFEELQKWINVVEDNIKRKYISYLIGNKDDLSDKEEVSELEAKQFAESKGYIFQKVSAKDGNGIEDLIENSITKFLEKYGAFQSNRIYKLNKKLQNGEFMRKNCITKEILGVYRVSLYERIKHNMFLWYKPKMESIDIENDIENDNENLNQTSDKKDL